MKLHWLWCNCFYEITYNRRMKFTESIWSGLCINIWYIIYMKPRYASVCILKYHDNQWKNISSTKTPGKEYLNIVWYSRHHKSFIAPLQSSVSFSSLFLCIKHGCATFMVFGHCVCSLLNFLIVYGFCTMFTIGITKNSSFLRL